LTLNSTEEPTTIPNFAQSAGTLTGPGTLKVTSSFTTGGSNVTMAGTGQTIIGSGATATLGHTGTMTLSEQRKLVNEGTLTFPLAPEGNIYMLGNAQIENTGTFKANAQPTNAEPFRRGTGSGQLIVNTGTFEKTEGSGNTVVDVKFENNAGAVQAKSGNLRIAEGGSSSGANSWTAAEGKKIIFGHLAYSMSSETSWSGDFEFASGTTTVASGINNSEGELIASGGSLVVNGGPLKIDKLAITGTGSTVTLNSTEEPTTIPNFAQSAGTLTGPGTLKVTSSFTTGGSNVTMAGTGQTIIGSGATATLGHTGTMTLSEQRKLVNEGTLTFPLAPEGNIYMLGNAQIENTGTFKANAQPTNAEPFRRGTGSGQLIVNTGTFEKTEGSGNTVVDVDFANLGIVGKKEGTLEIKRPVHIDVETKFGKRSKCGDPVDCATGDFSESQTDLAIGGLGIGLVLTRAYSARSAAVASSPGAFGWGWSNSFGDRLVSEEGGKKVTLIKGNGSTVPFTGGPGTFIAPTWSQEQLVGSGEAGYTLTASDQTAYAFSGSGRLESITDRNGNQSTLAYDEAGRLKEITDPSEREITLAYNGEGLVKSAEDPEGNVVEYTYESKQLKTVTLPESEGPRWQFKYDGSHRITEMVDGRGGKTTNVYDGSSRVTSQTDPGGTTLKFEYSAFHTRVTNEATGSVSDQWFTSNNQPFSITRGYGTPDASMESFSYNAAGQLLSVTDGNGHTTAYTYDAEGNRKSEKDAEGNETQWTYNGTHDVTSVTAPGGLTTTITRDADGNPEVVSRPAPEEEVETTAYAYDSDGQVESVTDPMGEAWGFGYDEYGNRVSETDPLGNTRTWEYDENSQPIATVAPRGNEEGAEPADFETTTELDAQGRPLVVTDPLGETTEFDYDGNGNLISKTDANENMTKFVYNAMNQRTKLERPSGITVETGYDGAGLVTSKTNGDAETTTYVRNALGQAVEVIDPLNRKTLVDFDDAGNMESMTDPAERVTSYLYDDSNRLIEVSYSDEATPTAEFDYDADGDVTSMIDGTGESTYLYDSLGRLIETQNGHGDIVGYDHDLAGHLTEIVYPNGKSVSRAFDDAGRLESVTDWLGGKTSFIYDADSNLQQTIFPALTGNVDTYAYDQAGRMSEATYSDGMEVLASLEYGREGVGQVDQVDSTGLPGSVETGFGYDKDNRLTEAGEAVFKYDGADNMTEGLGSANTYDAASQLETGTGVSYTYDALGARIESAPAVGPPTNYGYDQAGNLLSVDREEEGEVTGIAKDFTYDGTGLLVSEIDGMATSYFTWDVSEDLPLILNDDAHSYIYGPGGLPVAQISNEEAPTYLHHDQIGSTRLLTGASGEITATFSYGPYGELEGQTGSASTRLGFAAEFTDQETGLQYLRARFYDPSTAQFLTKDPLADLTGSPYGYAAANPLRYVDPSGMACVGAGGSGPGVHIPITINPSDCVGLGAGAETVGNVIDDHGSTLLPIGAAAACVLAPQACLPAAGAALALGLALSLQDELNDPCFSFVSSSAEQLLVSLAALLPGGVFSAVAGKTTGAGLTPAARRILEILLNAPGWALEVIQAESSRSR
jgi:RHS repeat-associated protein